MNLGTLNISSISMNEQLLAQPVRDFLASIGDITEVGVAEIDPTLSDTAAFCAHYGVQFAQAANCVVLEARRGEETWYVACVILATTKADINGLGRKILDVRKLSFAPMESAVTESKMEYGAITPVGLPHNWPILIDKAVIETPYVVIGSGIRKSKLIVSGTFLATVLNVVVVEGLGKLKEV